MKKSVLWYLVVFVSAVKASESEITTTAWITGDDLIMHVNMLFEEYEISGSGLLCAQACSEAIVAKVNAQLLNSGPNNPKELDNIIVSVIRARQSCFEAMESRNTQPKQNHDLARNPGPEPEPSFERMDWGRKSGLRRILISSDNKHGRWID